MGVVVEKNENKANSVLAYDEEEKQEKAFFKKEFIQMTNMKKVLTSIDK